MKGMRTSLKFLCGAVFMLTAFPRMHLPFGPAPLYIIDFFLAGAFYFALQRKPVHGGREPFVFLVAAIAFFAFISEFRGALYYGIYLEGIYMYGRTFLAISLFFSASRLITSEEDLVQVLRFATVGVLVSAVAMVMTSLPMTRGFIVPIMSLPFMDPAAFGIERNLGTAEGAVRGRSFIGYNILTGAFINTLWPLALLFYQWPSTRGIWKKLALAAVLAAPFGVVMSYSRGAISGMIAVFCGVLFYGAGRVRQGILAAAVLLVFVISLVGWDSEYFFFQRIENRLRATIENPHENERETERLYAYSEPFEVVGEHTEFLVAGTGLGSNRAGQRGYLDKPPLLPSRNLADHAVFAKATYTYGLLAAFCYVLLMGFGFLYAFQQIQRGRRYGGLTKHLPRMLFAGMFGMLSWFLLGHAAVSQPRGAMLFFLVLGLLAAHKNLVWQARRKLIEAQEPEEPSA